MSRQGRGEKYSILFTMFIFAIIVALIFNLISLNKNRFITKKPTRLYFADNMSAAHLKIINNFNKLYAGSIEIIPVDLPFSKFTTNERKELLARSLRSRSSRIDIFAVDQIWIPRFAKWGEPLAKYFMKTDLSRILPQALTTCYYENMLVGIPLYIDIGVLYYRKDLLDKNIADKLKASISWEELVELGKHRNLQSPYYLYQGDSYEGLICNYLEILGSMGGNLCRDGKFTINTEEGRHSAQFMLDLIEKYEFSPPQVASFNERESYFFALKNDVPLFRGWSSFLKDMPINTDDSVKVKKLGVAYLPHFGSHNPATVFGGWNLMISKYSTKKPEACYFLEYVLSEEAQKILFETSGYLPVLKSIYDDPDIRADHPYIDYLRKMMNSGIHRPMLQNYTKISDILSFYLNRVLKKEISVEEALRLADETIESDQLFLR
jgi:multiple sugar transport system substrate-binding protein